MKNEQYLEVVLPRKGANIHGIPKWAGFGGDIWRVVKSPINSVSLQNPASVPLKPCSKPNHILALRSSRSASKNLLRRFAHCALPGAYPFEDSA